jgi:hypothetical protein
VTQYGTRAGRRIVDLPTIAIDGGGTGATTAAAAFDAIKQPASDTATGVVEIAVQSEMEAGSDAARAVVPARQHYHPSAAKAWALVTEAAGSYTLAAAYNITSLNKTGTGVVEVNLTTAFSSTSYAVVAVPVGSSAIRVMTVTINTASKATVTIIRPSTEGLADNGFCVTFFGDQ